MKDTEIKILLCAFGSGSKLLQAYLNNSKKIFTLPAYPLLYFPDYFFYWKKNNNLTPQKLLGLIEIQFESIFDSRKIQGFNGTSQLGQNKKKYLKISKIRFKNFFIKFFKKKEMTVKNAVIAIHQAYKYSTHDKTEKILYHPHSLEIYKKHLYKNFIKSKAILTIRNPILNFWRSAYADKNIDKIRFDKSDYENLKNYRYINRLRDIYINFKNYDKNLKECRVFKFEELKKNKTKSLKKICKYYNITLNSKKIIPTFGNKIWWGSNIYKGSKENYLNNKRIGNQIEDQKKFFKSEILILEHILSPFLIKFRYKSDKASLFKTILFWFLIFLPTKYGIKLFLSRLSVFNLIDYLNNCLSEFKSSTTKNYYFNAMYRFKWSYSLAYLIRFNFIRKKHFYSKNNFFWNLLNLLVKVLLYPIYQLELVFMYVFRIYLIVNIKKIVQRNIIFMKILK